MGQNDLINSSQASVFVQTDPAEPYVWLSCAGAGDLSIPAGERTVVYRPNPKQSGKMQIWDYIEGTEGAPTLRLTNPFTNVINFLLEQKCRFQVRINYACAGDRPNTITSYTVSDLLVEGLPGTRGKGPSALGGGTTGAGTMVDTNAELQGLGYSLLYPLQTSRLTLASLTSVGSLVFVPEQCRSACRAVVNLGCIGYVFPAAAVYGYQQKTVDCGTTWNATAWQPFTIAGNDVSSSLTVEIATGYRVIVAGNLVDPLEPPEISYVDVVSGVNPTDAGLVAVNIWVGTVVNQGIHMLTRATDGTIWAAGTNGYIWYSKTLGVSWTTIATGAGQTFNDVAFLDDRRGFAVGNSNTFWYTADGATWAAAVGPAPACNLLTIAINRFGHIFVGDNAAQIWRTIDYGTTWEMLVDLGTGNVNRIRFDPNLAYVGYALYNNATPVGYLYRSEDGGVTWAQQVNPTGSNSGYNDLFVCDPNMVYVGGEPHPLGGTSYVAKWIRKSA